MSETLTDVDDFANGMEEAMGYLDSALSRAVTEGWHNPNACPEIEVLAA